MKIALINPPQTQLREHSAYPPLGLCYLAAVAEEKYECSIENLAGGVRELNHADVFGITCPTACVENVTELVEQIRRKFRNSIIVIGGPHPTVAPADSARKLKADYIIQGEAEPFMRKLHTLRRQSEPIIVDAGYVTHLDLLPLPARHLLDRDVVVNMTGIHGSDKPSTSILSSRGCPYRCTYCCKGHPMYSVFRLRSARNVLCELENLKLEYGIKHVRFVDDTFTVNKDRTLAISNGINRLGMTFICMTRADRIDEDIASALSGCCTQVQLGLETASPRLLALMNKGETVENHIRAISALKRVGIPVKVLLMMGYPSETKADREATLKFLGDVKPSAFNLSKFTPLPGSGVEWKGESEFFYPDEDDDWSVYRDQIQEAIA